MGDEHTTDQATDANIAYDRFANQYAALIRNHDQGTFSPYHDLVVPRLLELAGDVAGQTVLDAGCGEGYVARMLATRGARVTAIDVSPHLIDLARSTDPEGQIAYLTHDLSTPLPDYACRFDLVVSNLVFNDVYNHLGFASTLGTVTRCGGRLVLSMNNPYSAVIRNKVDNYFDAGKRVEYEGLASRGVHVLYHHQTLEQCITAFRDAGFLLRTLSDVGPAQEGEPAETFPQRYVHFPFFMIIEFVRQ